MRVMRNGGSLFFFFQAEDGIRDLTVTGVQTCALPICRAGRSWQRHQRWHSHAPPRLDEYRSEEHTSELQSQSNLVCRLLLEKKKTKFLHHTHITNDRTKYCL